MATGTLSPDGKQYFWNVLTGDPLAGGFVYTVTAGGVYPGNAVSTYTNVGLSVANSNPIQLNSAGYCTIFLTPGVSYKYIVTDANGVAQWTQDNIAAIPAGATGVDVTGTAGESLSAEQAVYLSDGSNGKSAGQWYKADADFAYACSTPVIGMTVSAISASGTGLIRTSGVLDLSTLSLTPGAVYYVSATAGAITTSPTANVRVVGQATTTTQIVLSPNPPPPTVSNNGVCDFRLTLETGVPVSTTDQTAKTTLFCTPYMGNRLTLFDAAGAPTTVISAQFSIAVPATTVTMYDIFCYNNSGVATLELLAWTNDTTRATAIVLTTTGVYTKSGDLTRRYLGSFRTTGSSGQTEDSIAKRYLWNYYNRVTRPMRVLEATNTWTYTSVTYQQANASTANQLDCVVGVLEDAMTIEVTAYAANSSASTDAFVSIGDGSITPIAGVMGIIGSYRGRGANLAVLVRAVWTGFPTSIGRRMYWWIEAAEATGTNTWYGDNNVPTFTQSGITGRLRG